MIRSGLILMIRQKAQSGQSSYSIGKELGISKNTVSLAMRGMPGSQAGAIPSLPPGLGGKP